MFVPGVAGVWPRDRRRMIQRAGEVRWWWVVRSAGAGRGRRMRGNWVMMESFKRFGHVVGQIGVCIVSGDQGSPLIIANTRRRVRTR